MSPLFCFRGIDGQLRYAPAIRWDLEQITLKSQIFLSCEVEVNWGLPLMNFENKVYILPKEKADEILSELR